ncbi:hypothetical protein ACLOJK_007227 [Asimina triloba]
MKPEVYARTVQLSTNDWFSPLYVAPVLPMRRRGNPSPSRNSATRKALKQRSQPSEKTPAMSAAAADTTPSAALLNRAEIEMIFNRFDSDSDGKISTGELASVLQALGSAPTPVDVERMIAAIDTDRDGFINLEEFAGFLAGEDGGDGRKRDGFEDLKDAFDMYDLNKDGWISAVELNKVLKSLGEECTVQDCHRMISTVDSDGDGKVNFEEFKKMMTDNRAAAAAEARTR